MIITYYLVLPKQSICYLRITNKIKLERCLNKLVEQIQTESRTKYVYTKYIVFLHLSELMRAVS